MYGKKLKTFRKCYEISQVQLAELLETSQACVSQWEHDLCNPKKEKLAKLQKICDKEGFKINFVK